MTLTLSMRDDRDDWSELLAAAQALEAAARANHVPAEIWERLFAASARCASAKLRDDLRASLELEGATNA